MDLNQLRGFAAVASEGHLTRAAEKLHVSQPALSAQIKALEEELQVALFDRVPTGMSLTPPGRRLLDRTQDVLSAAQRLVADAAALRGEVAGRVRLATVGDPEFVRLPRILARAMERSPLVEIELQHEVTGAAFAKVRDGEIDGAFYYGELAHPGVASMALRPFEFCVVGPSAWREGLARADVATLAEQPWILTPQVSTHRTLSDRLFARHGIEPRTVVQADNEDVIRSLVVSGLGVSLMRRDRAEALAEAGEVFIWEAGVLETRLQFVWPRARQDEPLIVAVRDLVREAWDFPVEDKPAEVLAADDAPGIEVNAQSPVVVDP